MQNLIVRYEIWPILFLNWANFETAQPVGQTVGDQLIRVTC
jgi:hypothetical protein